MHVIRDTEAMLILLFTYTYTNQSPPRKAPLDIISSGMLSGTGSLKTRME